MPGKELRIHRYMGYVQSTLMDWDHVAEVKEDLLANPLEGRLQLPIWDDKGMGTSRHIAINVTGYLARPL